MQIKSNEVHFIFIFSGSLRGIVVQCWFVVMLCILFVSFIDDDDDDDNDHHHNNMLDDVTTNGAIKISIIMVLHFIPVHSEHSTL